MTILLVYGLSILLHINIVSSTASYEHTAFQAADQCDWTGSGGGGRGVRPVYLRCSRGTVSWRYPRGALRVVLSPPLLATSSWKVSSQVENKNGSADGIVAKNGSVRLQTGFRACTKVSGPIRVYLETNGKLRSVYSPRDGKHEASHRCFYAKKQPAAFYIEAEESPFSGITTTRVAEAKLQYDLEFQHTNDQEGLRKFAEEEQDCRPCSMEELAEAYCRSDLVARGTVSAVQKQPDLEAAELIVGITKTLRRIEENEGNNSVESNDIDSTDTRHIRVRVPTACDARHGQGEFVIMAKRRLGDFVLVCAPRLETWAKAVRELESAPCVLRS